MAQLRLGRVRVRCDDPDLRAQARLAAERPTVDQGYGGWEEVARPRRAPLTTFRGSPAIHLTLPLLLDGWAAGNVVEDDIDALTRMARPQLDSGEPPLVQITARGAA